jgi:hypothetical protein
VLAKPAEYVFRGALSAYKWAAHARSSVRTSDVANRVAEMGCKPRFRGVSWRSVFGALFRPVCGSLHRWTARWGARKGKPLESSEKRVSVGVAGRLETRRQILPFNVGGIRSLSCHVTRFTPFQPAYISQPNVHSVQPPHFLEICARGQAPPVFAARHRNC